MFLSIAYGIIRLGYGGKKKRKERKEKDRNRKGEGKNATRN